MTRSDAVLAASVDALAKSLNVDKTPPNVVNDRVVRLLKALVKVRSVGTTYTAAASSVSTAAKELDPIFRKAAADNPEIKSLRDELREP